MSALVPVEEYLRSSYKPNCEYIDGVLRPKSIPTKLHSETEFRLVMMLRRQGVEAFHEVNLRMRQMKILIPDVIADVHIDDPYPTSPVKLCVEILSPDDRFSAVLSKCEEYHVHSYLSKIDETGTLKAGELNVTLSELFVS